MPRPPPPRNAAASPPPLDVDARDGDINDAIKEAERLMADAGWRTAGKWDAAPNAYFITVEREATR